MSHGLDPLSDQVPASLFQARLIETVPPAGTVKGFDTRKPPDTLFMSHRASSDPSTGAKTSPVPEEWPVLVTPQPPEPWCPSSSPARSCPTRSCR